MATELPQLDEDEAKLSGYSTISPSIELDDSVSRKNRAVTYITKTTATQTSYAFVATGITKTVTLAATSQLFCRPSGYTIC